MTGDPLYRLCDVWDAWRNGGEPTAIVSSEPDMNDTFCPM
jgi:hypothetical protein